jgi:hypothetical protein
MTYIGYFGLLFAFGVILFQGRHWWRTALLVTSGAFVVLGAYLIGEALLGLAVAVYLPLKERDVLETPKARARMKQNEALRSFPTKGKF